MREVFKFSVEFRNIYKSLLFYLVMNKRAQAFGIIVWAIILLLIGSMLIAYFWAPGSVRLENLPDAAQKVVETVIKVVTPVVSTVYALVAPAGQDENVQMIAFAIFMLLTLVGTKALKPFMKSKSLAFLISIVVGIIAARSLTATILEQSALAASPIAAVSLILGFIPIYAISRNLGKWEITDYSKMVVYTIVGVVYALIFAFAFKAVTLGIVYGVGVVLLGAIEMITPYYRMAAEERSGMGLGKYMAGVHSDIETVRAMSRGRGSFQGGAGI